MDTPSDLPLSGVRVLDLTRLLPGPMASTQLADMGAEVTKIEDTGIGDYARIMGGVRNKTSLFFLAVNRGKQFLRLDLKAEMDRQRFLEMVREADVVMESFRPSVMDKLDLGWTTLRAVKPSLVMCSISGYGQTGPYAGAAGHDINYLGYAGVLDQNTGADGVPVLGNLQIADLLGGAQAAVQGILAALIAARGSGKGRFVDISMTDNAFANNVMPLVAVNLNGQATPPQSDLLNGGVPCYNAYRTADHRFMAVGALELKFWQVLCKALERPDLAEKHWSLGQTVGGADAKRVQAELQTIFSTRTLAQWQSVFDTLDCCVTPVLRMEESLHHPLFLSREMIEQVNDPVEGSFYRAKSGIKFRE